MAVEDDTLGTWSTVGLADGDYVLNLWAGDHLGHTSEHTVKVTVDNTLPVARITQPAPDETHSGSFSIFGSVADDHLQGYTLRYARMPDAGRTAVPDTVWQVITTDTTSSLQEGLLATWDSSNETGAILLRLEAIDRAGNISPPAEVRVRLDNSGALPQAHISFPDPGRIVSGVVNIQGQVADDNFASYTLRAISAAGDTTLLSTSEEQVQGALDLWDTRSHAEESYILLLQATNQDGYSHTAQVPVTVDNTPPVVSLTSPAPETLISGRVDILCTVQDRHLKSYKLEYGPGANPDSSQVKLLGPGQRSEPVEEGVLATWETWQLNGLYALILSAEDEAGLQSRVKQVVQLENTEIKRNAGGFKAGDHVRLYLPPGAASEDIVVGIRFLNETVLAAGETSHLTLVGPAFEIESMPRVELDQRKPASLEVAYEEEDVMALDEHRLALFRWEETTEGWERVGGRVEEDANRLTAAVVEFGRYALMEDTASLEEGSFSLRALACQPRMISPRGGGFAEQMEISFELGRTTTASGRPSTRRMCVWARRIGCSATCGSAAAWTRPPTWALNTESIRPCPCGGACSGT